MGAPASIRQELWRMHAWTTVAGVGAQAALAAVFVVSALSKALNVRELRRTVEKLGVPASAAGIITAAEFVTAMALVMQPAASWPRGCVVVLAILFAGAGVRALASNEKITCSCFGGKRGLLGWRQLQLLPLWLLL